MSTIQATNRIRKSLKSQKTTVTPVVPPERVREMLREIAFVLHATRVVGRMSEVADLKE